MRNLRLPRFALLFLLIPLTSLFSQVVQTDKGKVEFIGLKRWSIKMIEDSLAVYVPKGHGLWGCAADLVGSLRFADASVIRYSEDSGLYSVITVVEPQDSARIQYRSKPSGSSANMPDFAALKSIIHKDFMAFQFALINYHLYSTGGIDSARIVVRDWGVDSVAVNAIWALLSEKNTQADKSLAVWTSLNNPDPSNRAIACAILTNFPEDDLTWWSLMDALRDKEPMVNTAARQALSVLMKSSPRTVDWAPCLQTLRFLLAGTNLFSYTTLLEVLQHTNVSPILASLLLEESTTDLLLAYLNAHHSRERRLARGLLSKLAGKDLGDDAHVWKQWLENVIQKD
jgi:hypothetical protein